MYKDGCYTCVSGLRYTNKHTHPDSPAHNNLRPRLQQRLHKRVQPVPASVEHGEHRVDGVEGQAVRFVEGCVVEAREQRCEEGGHPT